MVVETNLIWVNIHKFQGLPRIKKFLWLECKEKLMTNVERARRGFTMDGSCPRCGAVSEDIDHLLRGCVMSVAIWSSVIKPSRLQEFLYMDLHTWVVVIL
ncbi:hypothetical protein V6N11_039334 [Hibiscus sabdariffa]|uniref:Reverse transcriptase zinc-binding domain-containing protein n=1 Tax=Hibiscus sabdariffa TaxID=183260 RepID=A0ABR2SNB3_9ROSI